jgi:hypothetical protein
MEGAEAIIRPLITGEYPGKRVLGPPLPVNEEDDP